MSTIVQPDDQTISQQRAVPTSIRKRDGRVIRFDSTKIVEAVRKAFVACGMGTSELHASEVALEVMSRLSEMGEETPDVETIQDLVEKTLMDQGHDDVAKAYILYRQRRTVARDQQSALMRTLREITFASAEEADAKRENANVDGNSAMGSMLRYGTESAKQFNLLEVLDPAHAAAHRDGDIHIHDLDFLTLTTTCCQINLTDLFEHGFSTGHGVLRAPQSIGSYAALACIAIQPTRMTSTVVRPCQILIVTWHRVSPRPLGAPPRPVWHESLRFLGATRTRLTRCGKRPRNGRWNLTRLVLLPSASRSGGCLLDSSATLIALPSGFVVRPSKRPDARPTRRWRPSSPTSTP